MAEGARLGDAANPDERFFRDPGHAARLLGRAMVPWAAAAPALLAAALYHIGWSYKDSLSELAGFPGEAVDWSFFATVARGFDLLATNWMGTLLWLTLLVTGGLTLTLTIVLGKALLPDGIRRRLAAFFDRVGERTPAAVKAVSERHGRLTPLIANLWLLLVTAVGLTALLLGGHQVGRPGAASQWSALSERINQGCRSDCHAYLFQPDQQVVVGVPLLGDSKQVLLLTNEGVRRLPLERLVGSRKLQATGSPAAQVSPSGRAPDGGPPPAPPQQAPASATAPD